MKNIKILLFSVFSIIVLLLTSSVDATYSSASRWYNTPIIANDLQFEAKLLDNGSVETKWKAYNKNENLKYYKVVRSTKNSNPVYPDDWYIKYSSDINFTNYVDNKAPSGISYYRVCAITSEKNRYCSNVVKIYKDAQVEDSVACTMEYAPVCWQINWVNKTYWNKCMLKWANAKYLYSWKCRVVNINNSSSLSYNTKFRADKLVKSFILKIEKKYSTTEKRIEILTLIIKKFETLLDEKPQSSDIINYFSEKFQEQLNYYDNGFSEIEDILNDF